MQLRAGLLMRIREHEEATTKEERTHTMKDEHRGRMDTVKKKLGQHG